MAQDTRTKGLDLSLESDKELEDLLKNEMYMDIKSPFAAAIKEELERRVGGEKIETE